jgi:hypothetical protein
MDSFFDPNDTFFGFNLQEKVLAAYYNQEKKQEKHTSNLV